MVTREVAGKVLQLWPVTLHDHLFNQCPIWNVAVLDLLSRGHKFVALRGVSITSLIAELLKL